MKSRKLISLLALAAPLCADSSWPKIPAEVWAMKEDPAKGIIGAVVLEDHLMLRNTATEYTFRVRILSDKGRRAAQLPTFSKYVHSIEGHTIYPDGHEVTFNKNKDFAPSELTSRSGFDHKETVVIPPGVNGDCVVEVRWKESGTPGFGPLPPTSYQNKAWGLGNDFKTALTTLEVSIAYPFSWALSAGASTAPKQSEKSGMKIFTWENLPPFELPPYALEPTLPRPRVFAYHQGPGLHSKNGPEQYWSVVTGSYIMWRFSRDVSKGSKFKALAAEGIAQFAADDPPHTKAAKLLDLLFRKVRVLNQLTFQEQAVMTSQQMEREVDDQKIEETLSRGETDTWGMIICYFHLLKEAGLNPKLAAAANRENAMFDFNATNYYQISEWLVGIEEGIGTYWYDPSVRFGTPGVIRAELQGAPALMVDPKTWSASRGTLPVQPGAVNQQRYSYQVDVAEDEDLFQVKGVFSGIPEQTVRSRYLKLEPKEQSKTLKEEFEKDLTGCTVQSAELSDVVNPVKPLSYQVKGRIERENGRTRQVSPFPSMPVPLWVPDQLPKTRSLPIVLPYLRIHAAESVIHVPKGYRFSGIQPIQHQNQFGKVTWSATASEKDGVTEIRCVYRVDVTLIAAVPGAYAEFKTFLGWVSDSARLVLVLEKAH